MIDQINEYIANAPEYQQEVLKTLRNLILETVPSAEEKYKWNRPVYCLEEDFAYLQITKKFVNLGFFNYHKIKDTDHLLEGTGKDMRHMKFKNCDDIDETKIKDWLQAVTYK